MSLSWRSRSGRTKTLRRLRTGRAALVEQLGFAPVKLGKLAEGGLLVQARGKTWGSLIFQDFIKFEKE